MQKFTKPTGNLIFFVSTADFCRRPHPAAVASNRNSGPPIHAAGDYRRRPFPRDRKRLVPLAGYAGLFVPVRTERAVLAP